MTLGMRDGAPFFHCHGLWTEADGKASGGHMLPDETVVAEPFEVEASASTVRCSPRSPIPRPISSCSGRCPAASTGARTTSRAFALRLRPNQDFAGCLEAFCRAHGIARARIHGGVGSTIGARFTHGGVTEPFATELAVTAGHDRGRRLRRAGSGARHRPDRLHWRHCGGPSDPWGQSRADDHGAGARGVGLVSASDHQ